MRWTGIAAVASILSFAWRIAFLATEFEVLAAMAFNC
jgi:hypothetical protein